MHRNCAQNLTVRGINCFSLLFDTSFSAARTKTFPGAIKLTPIQILIERKKIRWTDLGLVKKDKQVTERRLCSFFAKPQKQICPSDFSSNTYGLWVNRKTLADDEHPSPEYSRWDH
jgi:hypothetical protein